MPLPITRTTLLLASLAALAATPAFAEIGRVKSSSGAANVERGTDKLPAATGQELLAGEEETAHD